MDLIQTTFQDPIVWNSNLTHHLKGHLLQSWEWGQFKQRYGWKATYLSWKDGKNQTKAQALILKRTIASRFSILYCPRGPALDWSDETLSSTILSELAEYARSENAIFLKIDPYLVVGTDQDDVPDSGSHQEVLPITQQLHNLGWQPSCEQIQFRNTMLLDLDPPENDLLKQMKQKTRYNVRLASRKGVKVRKGGLEDLDLLYQIYAETAIRDGFTIRETAYYQDAWGAFCEANLAQPFIAEKDGDPIAGIIVFQFGKIVTYMYGMSRAIHRDKMPNHLLQWEAIRWAKSLGCETYDFWGAPDHLEENDPLWGVYRFKKGFGAEFIRLIGAWDHPVQPTLYKLYGMILPKVLGIMRLRGRSQTQRTLNE